MNLEIAAAASHISLVPKDDPRSSNPRRIRRGQHASSMEIEEKDYELEELAGGSDERNWKGIVFALLVIAIVCTLVGVSAWYFQPQNGKDYKYTFDFDALFDPYWQVYHTGGKWIGDVYAYVGEYGSILKWTAEDGTQVLISNETLNSLAISQYRLSPDMKYALLGYNVESIFRHSTKANYYIYTILTGSHVSLSDEQLQYADWGAEGSQLVYVFNSDIYYKSDVSASSIQITFNGKSSNGDILNGIADWIYEEEMLESTKANWFSPSGSYLAYASFNDTLVPEMDLVVYSISNPYTEIDELHYPKPGYKNPTVRLYVYDLTNKKKVEVLVPVQLHDMEPLLNSVVWTDDNKILVTWSSRYQNTSYTSVCSPSLSVANNLLANCEVVFEQTEYGWIQHVGEPPVPGPTGTYFQIAEKMQGGRGNFYHLLMVKYNSRPVVKTFLTSGTWEVTKVLKYDAQKDIVYFIGNKEDSGYRHLYSVELEKLQTPVCYTCSSTCKYIRARISLSSKSALISCSGPGVPFAYILNLQLKNETTLESNTVLQDKVSNCKMPEIKYEDVSISTSRAVYDLKAKLYLPKKRKKKLPLFVYVYGGPASQEVDSQFVLDWKTYLVNNLDIALMMFDGRGSGFKGSNILKAVNRNLGKYEIEDQISAIKQVLEKNSFLDKDRVAIMGWSYGGYASAMVASHPDSIKNNLINCAISVAPLVDWRLYDSIYTERYMGSPVNNVNKYIESSMMNHVANFDHFKYLLVHGTRDDNVHFQNSALLETALVNNGILHRFQMYTNAAHGLDNDGTRVHLYRLLTEFLGECFHEPET